MHLQFDLQPETDPQAESVVKGHVFSLVEEPHRSLIQDTEHPDIELVLGDNLAALSALYERYEASVDVIYLDPPYNTGKNVFTYVDKHEGTKKEGSSIWLSLMKRRLMKAYDLLNDEGVIMVSIGNEEHAHLRILMDEIFGSKNFISNLVWIGNGASNATFTRGGIDYILIYAKNKKLLTKWQTPKPHAEKMMNVVSTALARGKTHVEAEKLLKAYIARNPDMSGGMKSYHRIDKDGEIYTTASIVNSLYRPNLKFDVTDPETGRVYPSPEKGWTMNKETFTKRLNNGEIVFSGNRPRRKILLRQMSHMLPSSLIDEPRSIAHNELARIIGKGKFTYPKNVSVIKQWLKTSTYNRKDAVILDFFAGSGTTGQAVAEMNTEDEGQRTCILVTNNESNIADEVTIPRIKNVLTGEWADGKEHEPLRGNLHVYELE